MQTAVKTAEHTNPIRSHCEMLHSLAEGIDGVLVVSAYNVSDKGKGTVTHHRIGDVDGMVAAIAAHHDTTGTNVYVGLQVMRKGLGRGERGGTNDVKAVLGLVADMDGDTGKTGEPPFEPSYIVETSPGNEHPAWLFDNPLTPDEAKPLAAALQRATGSDSGTKDIAHVWRVPGTKNWPNEAKLKRGRAPEPANVRTLQAWNGDLVSVEAFRTALAPWSSAPTSEAKPVQLGELPNVGDVKVSEKAAALLAANDVDDRSKHARAVIEQLNFDGHGAEEAAALFLAAPGNWLDRYANEQRARTDFERVWGKEVARREERREAAAKLAGGLKGANDNEAGADADGDGAANASTKDVAFVATPYVPADPSTLPRREWLFGNHYIRKYVSVTVSPGGLGKTSSSIVESLSMVSGKPLLSPESGLLPKRLKAWLFNGEDPRDEMVRRIEAARLHYKLSAEDIGERLFLDVGRERELVVVIEDRKAGIKINEPVAEAVVKQIKDNEIDVMIVDPFVSTHQVNENDNGAIDRVAKLWAKIADRANCSIDLVAHTRKLNGEGATIDDVRGAGSLIGAARSVRVLNRMSREQANLAGVPERDVAEYFHIDIAKANMTKQDSRLEWRRLEGVGLGNGDGISKPQDHVGVVTPWKFPSKEATAEKAASEITADQLEKILVRLKNQTSAFARNSNSWAGFHVMDALGLNRENKDGRDQAAKIIGGLIADGTLIVKQEEDHRRHKTNVVRPRQE
ncbi:AAA family ATPase [Bradyrhizobium australafricanum]|uniref:AAA family ATPase n=1 Tax=Bradyrhizobium australafricanum TaxID=2821406 RepID=UPI001CE2A85C|nr:AAA family ATPase [Bradyrhizobium australafricanum]MCA6098850.1 AAA family ATPase [Bradyrhizobium australafricanum]